MTTAYQIYTTINTYLDGKGKAIPTELPFPKLFFSKQLAQDFGAGYFEPPGSVLAWRIKAVEQRESLK